MSSQMERHDAASTLLVNTEEVLRTLPDPAKLEHVHTVYLGARLHAEVMREELFDWIARLPSIRRVFLSDDWIADEEMPAVEADFAASLPDVKFHWSYDGLVGGKHGR